VTYFLGYPVGLQLNHIGSLSFSLLGDLIHVRGLPNIY